MEDKFNFKSFKSIDFVENAAIEIKKIIENLLHTSETINIALSGGNTPLPIYKKLSQFNIDWKRIRFFMVDERCVSTTSKDNNYKNIYDVFFKNIKAKSFQVIEKDLSFKKCAENYEKKILKNVKINNNIPSFDLLILGMGLDGHTASLFPETKALKETKKIVVLNDVPQLETQRITMTFPLIKNSKKIVLITKGKQKKNVLINSLKKKTPISKLIKEIDIILN